MFVYVPSPAVSPMLSNPVQHISTRSHDLGRASANPLSPLMLICMPHTRIQHSPTKAGMTSMGMLAMYVSLM